MVVLSVKFLGSNSINKLKDFSVTQKVLIIAIPSYHPFVIATCLEFALRNIQEGKRIIVINLAWLLPDYYRKNFSRYADNFSFKPPVNYAIKSWCKTYEVPYFEPKFTHKFSRDFSRINSSFIESIFEVTLRSVHSKSFGTKDFNINKINRTLRFSNRNSFTSVLDYLHEFFLINSHIQVDKIVTVNGRFLIDSAVVLYCKLNDTKYSVLETVTSDWNNFIEFEIGIHNLSEAFELMMDQWHTDYSIDPIKTSNIAVGHMEKRLSNTWSWNPGLGDGKDITPVDKKFVTFFPSTDWEFGVYEYLNDIGHISTQHEVFRWVAEFCQANNYCLIVRVHPHPNNPRIAEIENTIWEKLTIMYGGILIKSNDSINSHKIAKESFFNIVYQSSIGAEFLYLGYPTIITRKTLYTLLVPESEATTKEQFNNLIKSYPIINDRKRLLPWAYFSENGGTQLNFFKNLDNYTSTYKNGNFLQRRPWFLKMRRIYTQFTKFF
jgi:hypothetical protein